MHIPQSFLFGNGSAQTWLKRKMWFLYKFPLVVFFKGFISNVHVINDDQRKHLETIKFHGNVDSIPDFVYRGIEKIEFNYNEFVILFTGVLSVEIKGADLLSGIIHLVLEMEKKIKFCIAGPPGNGKKLIDELILIYPDNVAYKGFVTEPEMEALHRNASLFIVTSKIESFSLGIVGAQSYGLPCIAFSIPGPKDILTKVMQGCLVTPFKINEFSDAILRFYAIWLSDKTKYFLLKNDIQKNIYGMLGKDTIIPRIINLFCSGD